MWVWSYAGTVYGLMSRVRGDACVGSWDDEKLHSQPYLLTIIPTLTLTLILIFNINTNTTTATIVGVEHSIHMYEYVLDVQITVLRKSLI